MKLTLATIALFLSATSLLGQNYSTFYGTYDVNANINVNKNVNVSGTVNQNINKTVTTIDYGALAAANAQKEEFGGREISLEEELGDGETMLKTVEKKKPGFEDGTRVGVSVGVKVKEGGVTSIHPHPVARKPQKLPTRQPSFQAQFMTPNSRPGSAPLMLDVDEDNIDRDGDDDTAPLLSSSSSSGTIDKRNMTDKKAHKKRKKKTILTAQGRLLVVSASTSV